MTIIITPSDLLEKVCEAMQEDCEKIKKPNREKQNVFVRQIYSFIARKYFQFSWKAIAEPLDQDHTSAMNSVSKISDFIDIKDYKTLNTLNHLKSYLEIPEIISAIDPFEKKYKELARMYQQDLKDVEKLKVTIDRLVARLNKNKLKTA